MRKKINALFLWDYHTFTGFATVSKNLYKNFRKHFGENLQMDIVAINYFEDEYKEDLNTRVIPAKKFDVAKDDFGRYVFMKSLIDNDYDLIFIVQDLGVVSSMIPLLADIKKKKRQENRKSFKSIFYFPVDFALTPNLGVGLEFFDYLATYTEYGKTHTLAVNPKVRQKLYVIPHGNNSSDFYPIDKSEANAFRSEYFKVGSDRLIVTNVNRNQTRKDIPTTIFGFMEYWDKNPNAFLYLHMDAKDPMGWDLRTILSQTPLVEGKDYMLADMQANPKGYDVQTLNKIYNASDIFLTTATSEGWGLTITEAMATRTPVIAPDHTSVGEICGHGTRAYMLFDLIPAVAMVDNVIRWQSDIYEIADTIEKVKQHIDNNSGVLTSILDNAYEFVTSLKWEDISKKFIAAIEDLTK